MKAPFTFILLCLLISITSCQTNRQPDDEVVCETVHRYGVPLAPDDWSERGQNGQVVSIRKDGVTVSRSYDAGVLHGECTYTFPNRDVVQKKEIYHQGSLTQEFAHYPNGLPQQQKIYQTPSRLSAMVW